MVNLIEYERIIIKYREPIFKYCYYRLHGNIDLTEETVDDILHVLYRKWDTLDTDGNIRAWLYRVADREIRSHLKQYKRYYKYTDSLEDAISEGRTDNLQYTDEYFSDNTPEEEYMERIRQSLSGDEQEIFTLRFMEKRTLEQTAQLMNMPYSTLRLRISKLEVRIREKINSIFEE